MPEFDWRLYAGISVAPLRRKRNGAYTARFHNRSMTNVYAVRLDLAHFAPTGDATVFTLSEPEPTSHNGVDIAPTTPGYRSAYEPYSSIPAGSATLRQEVRALSAPISVPPFSVVVVEVPGDAVAP